MSIFINFSNHPSKLWDENQKYAAIQYGKIKDISFPHVDPLMTYHDIEELSKKYLQIICDFNPLVVLVQGEMTLCFQIITELKKKGIKVVCACSNRISEESTDNQGRTLKQSVFQFVQFREY